MTRKHSSTGVFAAMGRAADESLEIAEAIRAGKLTRSQFESWYTRRRAEGTGLVITLREKTADLAKPLEGALVRGEELIRSAGPKRVRRVHRVHRVHRKAKAK